LNFDGEELKMPKFIQPKDGCGLALRAVIEGELFNSFPALFHEQVKLVADRIETRIQDGPSDWLSLSDGTTFEKSFVPGLPTVERWQQFGGNINTAIDPIVRAADSIHAAHEKRVKTNSKKASKRRIDKIIRGITLRQDIADHDVWLHSLGSKRIFVQ
jgi:hypothetical protein